MSKRTRRYLGIVFIAFCVVLAACLQACGVVGPPEDAYVPCDTRTPCPSYLGCGTDNVCHARCDFGATCPYGACVKDLCYYNPNGNGSVSPGGPSATSSSCAAPLVRSDLPATVSSGSAAIVDDKYLYYLAAKTDSVGNTTYSVEQAALDGSGTPTSVQSVPQSQPIVATSYFPAGEYLFYNDPTTGALTRVQREGAHEAEVLSTSYGVAGAKGTTLFVHDNVAYGSYYRMTTSGVVDSTPLLPSVTADAGPGPQPFYGYPNIVFSESKALFLYPPGTVNMYIADITSGAAVDSGHALPQNAGSPYMAHGSKLYYPVNVNQGTNLVEIDLGDPSSAAAAVRQNLSANIIGMDDAGFLYFADSSNPSGCGALQRFPVSAPTSTPTSIGVLPDYQIQTQQIIGIGAVYAFESYNYGSQTSSRRLYRYKTN